MLNLHGLALLWWVWNSLALLLEGSDPFENSDPGLVIIRPACLSRTSRLGLSYCYRRVRWKRRRIKKYYCGRRLTGFFT